ncbi:MAG: hypothetical protein OK454_05330, partial [Thaumarchaeota archaeon]|nr:hypothetical protein [Nitrososphaerota archaeon]
ELDQLLLVDFPLALSLGDIALALFLALLSLLALLDKRLLHLLELAPQLFLDTAALRPLLALLSGALGGLPLVRELLLQLLDMLPQLFLGFALPGVLVLPAALRRPLLGRQLLLELRDLPTQLLLFRIVLVLGLVALCGALGGALLVRELDLERVELAFQGELLGEDLCGVTGDVAEREQLGLWLRWSGYALDNTADLS